MNLFANKNVKTPDFDYPKDVSKKASADLSVALKTNDGKLMVDALVRFGIAEGSISQDNLPVIIKKIEQVAAKESRPDYKALLLTLEASVFKSYSWSYAKARVNPEGKRPADYTEWGNSDFDAKASELMNEAVAFKDALRQCPITNYSGIITYNELGALYKPSLYDFILDKKKELTEITEQERTDQFAFLQQNGFVPAYLYAQSGLLDEPQKIKLYNECKENEHSGCLLQSLPEDTTSYNALKDYIHRFPNGLYAKSVANRKSTIESKLARIQFGASYSSRDSIEVKYTIKNVNDFTISVYRLPDNYLTTDETSIYSSRSTAIDTKRCKLVATYHRHVSNSIPFYKEVTDTATLPPLPYGRYTLIVSFKKGRETIESPTSFNDMMRIYDITSFNVACEKAEARIFAVDRLTGAPIKGATVKGEHINGVTASDGSIALPKNFEDDDSVMLTKDADKYGPLKEISQFDDDDDENSIKSADIFTDLAIYRPGESVKFAMVLYRRSATARTVVSGEKVTVQLYDANYKSVKELKLTTDAFGRCEGQFTIPTDRLNGSWQVTCIGIGFRESRRFEVSEYKTPTFAIEFPDMSHNFVSKQPVKISGTATTYSGMPIANTEVSLMLTKRAWSWYWRYDNDEGSLVNDTTVTTDDNGRFTIEYPASMLEKANDDDDDVNNRWYSYALNAKITTSAGESREACHTFVIGKRRSISISNFTHNNGSGKQAKLPVIFNSTDEADKSLLCTYALKDEDGKVVKASSFKTNALEADFADVASGKYTIEVQLADEPAIKDRATLVIYRPTDKTAPVKGSALWIPSDSYRVDDKNVAHALIGVSVPESHIYYVAASRAGIVKQGWLHLKQGLHNFSLQIPNAPDEYLIMEFVNVYKDKQSRESHLFNSVINEQKLEVKLNSFRDKLVPGEKERWTMQFVDQTGRPVQSAMMLEMYDKALESLGSNKWSFNVRYLHDSHYKIQLPFEDYWHWNYAFYADKTAQNPIKIELPTLNLYNKDFFSQFPQYLYLADTNNVTVKAFGTAPRMLSARAKKSEALVEYKESSLEEVVVTGSAVEGIPTNSTTQKEDNQLNNIKLREADVKTALWMPTLTSDTDGQLTVEFEAPEFSTTWVMQAIAYTSNMVSNSISKEVMTQKPIMVKSSLPRFVRGGDKATLKANVMNATDTACTYTAIIELFDPRTQKVVRAQNFSGTLGAKGTEVISIECSVPDTVPFIGFRVKAANTHFGDGEQIMLPVLSNATPVIEATPFFADAGTPHFEVNLPQIPKGSRVTLEYCDNPVWYCVTALPTIFNSNYQITTNLAHSLFAEVLAQGVARSNPLIKTAIKQWKSDEQDSTLTSMLAKNKDLKISDLLASPWVNEADRQSLRMSKLIELFDEKKMAIEHGKIVAALQKLQRTDGGFPWYEYPNCKSNLWTTETVIELIGELQHLGYLKDDKEIASIVKKAIAYYDKEMLAQWNQQQKRSKKNYSGFSSYVYNRTIFPGIALPKANANMMKKALTAMTKDWKGLPLGEKAYYAMALYRNGHKQVASRIVESVRQFAIIKPELGKYWDNLQVGWRYFDKVAVTATILEAMNEVGAEKGEIDQIRKWMLLMKQTNDWGSSSLAADAVYALLSTGSQWLERGTKPSITIDGEPVKFSHIDEYVGYCRKAIPAQSGATLKIDRQGASPAWGAVYSQYVAPMASVEAKAITELSISKEYLIYGANGALTPATDRNFKVGDKVQVRVVIKNNKDLDFLTVTDQRGACFEPKDQTSGYRYMDGCYFYQETKDAQTNLFFTSLGKGTHIVSYDVYVNVEGSYSAGIATAQCQYAPQMTAHSSGDEITVGK